MSKTGASTGALPGHIAIIMDGNGRWASKRFLPRGAGHRAGADNLRKLTERMNDAGFKHLTVFAFSTENRGRQEEEVRGLMALLSEYIQRYIDDAKKNTMRISMIGNAGRLSTELREKISYLTELTREHTGMRVVIALHYGGRDEIIRAAGRLVAEAVNGNISSLSDITEDRFASYLDTYDMPDPDLVIRTSGENRLSNFLLWQTAYSEIYISPKLWPDFGYDDLILAVEAYQSRDRRYGK